MMPFVDAAMTESRTKAPSPPSARNRRTRAWLLRFATLCAIFAGGAATQHWLIHREVYLEADRQLADNATRVTNEMAPGGRWDVQAIRQNFLNVAAWYVVDSTGQLLDNEADVPQLFQNALPISDSIVDSPRTVANGIGEGWRLLAKRLDSGLAIVGVSSPISLEAADRKLRANLNRIRPTLREAAETPSKAIEIDVSFAVISAGGELRGGVGGIPLRTDYVQRFGAVDKPVLESMSLAGKSYRILSRPVVDSAGRAIGAVIVPAEMELRLQTLRILDTLNVGLLALLLTITAACAAVFAGQEWRRERHRVAIRDALTIGEGSGWSSRTHTGGIWEPADSFPISVSSRCAQWRAS